MFKETFSWVLKELTQLGGKPMQHIVLLLVVLYISTTALAASEGSIRITGKVWETTTVSQAGARLNVTSSTSTKAPQLVTLTSSTSSTTFVLDEPSAAFNLEQHLEQDDLLTLSITTL